MTDHPTPESKIEPSPRRGMNPATILTVLVMTLLLIYAGRVFWLQIQETPAREIGILMPPYGIITVRLTTEPFPPTITGPVQMTLRMNAGGGSTINVDRVSYSYSMPGGREPVAAEARQVARNTYQGGLRFDSVGDWQVTIKIENDGRVNEGMITIPVKPAI